MPRIVRYLRRVGSACRREVSGIGLCEHSKNKTPVLGNAIPVLVLKLKRGKCVGLFFNIDLCSASSMGSSRRDLLNDMTEHRPIFKNNQSTYHPRFAFTPKTGISIPQNGVLFLCERKVSLKLSYLCCSSFFASLVFLMKYNARR